MDEHVPNTLRASCQTAFQVSICIFIKLYTGICYVGPKHFGPPFSIGKSRCSCDMYLTPTKSRVLLHSTHVLQWLYMCAV